MNVRLTIVKILMRWVVIFLGDCGFRDVHFARLFVRVSCCSVVNLVFTSSGNARILVSGFALLNYCPLIAVKFVSNFFSL